jgi:hypothetical protein
MTTTADAFDLSSSAVIARPNTGCTPSPVKYPPETTSPLAISACPSTLAFTCSKPAKAKSSVSVLCCARNCSKVCCGKDVLISDPVASSFREEPS